MQIIRVFPVRTSFTPDDELAFVGDPPLFRPTDSNIPVHVSVTFTWDIQKGERLKRSWERYYKNVSIGGPAYASDCSTFTPGMYVKEGITFTSRGCSRNCRWCYVPAREGKIIEIPIAPGHIIQDNNLFACSHQHVEKVFDMLRMQRKGIVFSGGIDARLFNAIHLEMIRTIKLRELWFACDTDDSLENLKAIASLCEEIPQKKKRCYSMIGFNGESIQQAESRLNEIYQMGFDPFCQLYRGPKEREYTREWKQLARKWSRPAIYKASMDAQGDMG